MLIAARAIQGIGAAIISPAALSIITTTFEEGPERNKALGIWGAMGGGGAAVGVLMGGILTEYLGWEWIFFVNVPIGALVCVLAPRIIRESRVEVEHKRYDVAGAITVTAGLMLLVFTIVKAPDVGWASARTIGLFAVSAILLVLFLVIETRSRDPLMPLSIFRLRTLAGANIVGLILGSITFSMFFILSLYMQQVLEFSALESGLGYLAVALTAVFMAGASQALVTKVGVKPILIVGMSLLTAGLVWFTQVSADGSYSVDLLPGFFMIGTGLAFSFVPVSIAALAGVTNREAGLASGLINTSQQIGGALGTAILATVAFTHAETLIADGTPPPFAFTSGYSWAFWVGAVMAAVGVLATIVFIRREDIVTVPGEAREEAVEPASA
jgi:EmrB/QacA subfamily drug resistance transporter